MTAAIEVTALTLLAGLAIPIGGTLARIERIQPRWLQVEFRHSIIAFGGGILLSAVAVVLVPHAMRNLSLPAAVVAMGLGGVVFCLLDIALARARTSAAQLLGLLADFLPEALALGAAYVTQRNVALLLALVIALQNLPEGFNAYRELRGAGRLGKNFLLWAFLALALLGPVVGLVGLHWLAPFPQLVCGVMLFGAGGILYITFQDIAPQAKLKRHWAPALGAVGGYILGMVGQWLIAPELAGR